MRKLQHFYELNETKQNFISKLMTQRQISNSVSSFCSTQKYTYFWIPIVGPHIGAIVGALLYKLTIGIHWPHEYSPVETKQQDEEHMLEAKK